MILVLLCLYYARYSNSLADLPGATATAYPRDDQIVFVTNYRSTFDIIQSCLATIFACTWGAMHPDVPKDRSTWWNKNKKQIYLFLGALLGPEVVIPQAMGDWLRAQIIMSQIPSYTLAQCHFLAMGGVVFRNDTGGLERYHPHSSPQLEALNKHPIDADEISARSKSSVIGKGLVVIQVLWFVLQCIARGAQGLAITELEIMTLGYAALNGVLYALWWYKPAGVEVPLIIDLSWALSEATQKDRADIKISEEKPQNDGPSQVAEFFLHLSDNRWENFRYLGLGVVGSIFGGLHCIAFSFHFPSHVASMLWKVCALYVTIAPLPMVFLLEVGMTVLGQLFTQIFIAPIVVLVTVGYAAARIILVVISFWALTSIPQSGHLTAVWTKYIPHL